MMQQLQQERAAASNVVAEIIQPILDESIGLAVLESQAPLLFSFSEAPDSPVYCPPEVESEDEAMVSAEVGGSVSYECTECQRRHENIFEIMMHLENDHGEPDDEEMLMMKVREIKSDDFEETSNTSVQVNNNEDM